MRWWIVPPPLIAETKDQLGGPHVPKFENPANEVATYQDGFTRLLEIALPQDESLALIDQVARELERGG